MKTVRGSSRLPSNTPRLKKKKKSDQSQKTEEKQSQDLQAMKSSHLKPSARSKGESQPSGSSKTSQKNLKLIQMDSISALENMMDVAILSTIVSKKKNKKEIQESLNVMKKRFLEHCRKLRVPAHIQKNLECLSRRRQVESKKSDGLKQTLSTLKEDLNSVVSTLEKLEEEMESLRDECRMLTDQGETEEEKAREIFAELPSVQPNRLAAKMFQLLQASKASVLNLHVPPPQEDEVTLESEMRRELPESDPEAVARKLGRFLQSSEAVRDAQALLRQAHRHTDKLLGAT